MSDGMAGLAAPELVITRVFDAPPALVFKLWTDPSHLVRWFGPPHAPATRFEMDARPGGPWRACMRSAADGAELWLGGTVREIEPPHRLVFSFTWENAVAPGVETLVTLTFAATGDKTTMRLHQVPFLSAESRDGHAAGWTGSFDRLAAFLASAA